MNRVQMKNKLKSTVNHIKSHPALYAYAAGAVIGITSTYFAADFYLKDYLKDVKLVDLNAALTRIQDEGLTGLKYKMNDFETLVLIPVMNDTLPQ